jgi:threonine/homoserine/homoserine lactone efflux protein
MAAAITGVAALLHTSAVAFSVLKYLGVAYLLYLYGVLAAAVRDQVIARPRVPAWMGRAFAGSFLALSAKLALTRQ